MKVAFLIIAASALALASTIASPPSENYEHHVYYVRPKRAACGHPKCLTLDQVLQYSSTVLQSNTALLFLPGHHTLDQDTVLVESIYNLTLRGTESDTETGPAAIIQCTRQAIILFRNVKSVVLDRLTFQDCGAKVYYIRHYSAAAALYFYNISNLTVTEVVVRNSLGYGMLIVSPNGVTNIGNSLFDGNHGNSNFMGGNMYVHFELSDCSKVQSDAFFSIVYSRFIDGSTSFSQQAKSPGLHIDINHSCMELYIELSHLEIKGVPLSISSNVGNLGIHVYDQGLVSTARHHIRINNCHLWLGVTHTVGGGFNFLAQLDSSAVCKEVPQQNCNSLKLIDSVIEYNMAIGGGGGGMAARILQTCQRYCIHMRGVMIRNNFATRSFQLASFGGNLLLALNSTVLQHSIQIENCYITAGEAEAGGGLLLLVIFPYLHGGGNLVTIDISNTSFSMNDGTLAGGGVSINMVQGNVGGTKPVFVDCAHQTRAVIKFENNTFISNQGVHGSALMVITNSQSLFCQLPVFLQFVNSTFSWNESPNPKGVPLYNVAGSYPAWLKYSTTDSATILLANTYNATFSDCVFTNNNSTALVAANSNLFFTGHSVFLQNVGRKGGGLALYDSLLYLDSHSEIDFVKNDAKDVGGGIYVEQKYDPFGALNCFLQLNVRDRNDLADSEIKLQFVNNTANLGGSALYGGYVDWCSSYPLLLGPSYQQWETFGKILNFSLQTGNSIIASDPLSICFCNHSNLQCSRGVYNIQSYPGDYFALEVAVVGQRNGIVPGVITAILQSGHSSLGEFQESQSIQGKCTNLTYRILSNRSAERMELKAENPTLSESQVRELKPILPLVEITLLLCPMGFGLIGMPPECGCSPLLNSHGFQCDIRSKVVLRPNGKWIGSDSSHEDKQNLSVYIHDHCPLDYCKSEDTYLNLSDADEQCISGRSGVLCGGCKRGLSIAFGTSHCLRCSSWFILLLFAFALAGVVLVVFLKSCNLTVSVGMVNGVIFYANVLHLNQALLFSSDSYTLWVFKVLEGFIAWLNLDLGIETCFYDGLDMYAKTWLQFAFPVYVWTIVLFMIVVSHYSTMATKLIGRHSVKVLATLFLLSYTKLLRTIITALSFTTIEYADRTSKAVWLYDGNVEYLQGKHIPLFLIAVIALIVLLPYTCMLALPKYVRSFTQCSNCRSDRSEGVPKVMQALQHILDAYTAPYKAKYHFWAGLLLLVRIVLFLTFAFNILGDPQLNMLMVCISSICLLTISFLCGGVHKNHYLSIIENSFFFNLSILSASTLYVGSSGSNPGIAGYTSISVAMVTFVGILFYHMLMHCLVPWLKRYSRRRTPVPITDEERVATVHDPEAVEAHPVTRSELIIEGEEVVLVSLS